MPYECIGMNIQNQLQTLKKTQKWLAEQCGVTKGQISHIVRGRSYPSYKLLANISLALALDVSILLTYDSENQKRVMS
ncbi:helix-turn-helix transcriptional regulator [Desulfitobacterium sp.]|uniref:helix-turn-helix domain-containing protein n=1 Tax=Desulfitobacterium sp. TaxID=49981 RepID=UPI002C77F84F|nr:helix-turn-helix transcriptional regulator [Desulfitobacterium sp.]HVJ50053.1 helix-turn-helix transcriptional regulator [Desulfitobacterium sp.]